MKKTKWGGSNQRTFGKTQHALRKPTSKQSLEKEKKMEKETMNERKASARRRGGNDRDRRKNLMGQQQKKERSITDRTACAGAMGGSREGPPRNREARGKGMDRLIK